MKGKAGTGLARTAGAFLLACALLGGGAAGAQPAEPRKESELRSAAPGEVVLLFDRTSQWFARDGWPWRAYDGPIRVAATFRSLDPGRAWFDLMIHNGTDAPLAVSPDAVSGTLSRPGSRRSVRILSADEADAMQADEALATAPDGLRTVLRETRIMPGHGLEASVAFEPPEFPPGRLGRVFQMTIRLDGSDFEFSATIQPDPDEGKPHRPRGSRSLRERR